MVTLRVAVSGSVLKWRLAMSDVPWESLLGLVLFNLFVGAWTVGLSAPSAACRSHARGKGCYPEGPR